MLVTEVNTIDASVAAVPKRIKGGAAPKAWAGLLLTAKSPKPKFPNVSKINGMGIRFDIVAFSPLGYFVGFVSIELQFQW
ncbi:hypothetical protein [Propionibacterium acidifaciens]|uniref:hypothetical protein n=1 Tax=Propionibacterium acidifaciens TaxID=556499 RepID=UPI000F4E2843|nr:hypothetical protein [Propionibacterium acidifaciens]